MQVRHEDGSETLEQIDSMEPVKKALANPKVRSVSIHKPGSTFTGGDGVKYHVGKDGAIRPTFDTAASKKKRKAQKKARRKNR